MNNTTRSIRKLKTLTFSAAIVLSGLSATTIDAADGDIIISRDVQLRSATRQPLVPDPSPRVVNPRQDELLQRSLESGLATVELSDKDFGQVTSGVTFITSKSAISSIGQTVNRSAGATHHAVGGVSRVGHSGGSAGRAGSQVGRSIQQGLRPLQLLGRTAHE